MLESAPAPPKRERATGIVKKVRTSTAETTSRAYPRRAEYGLDATGLRPREGKEPDVHEYEGEYRVADEERS